MKKFNLSSVVEKQSAKYIHGWLKGQSDNSNRDFLQIGCNKGKQAADFIALKALEYQDNLISSLGINEILERLENASNNQLDADSLFVAEYINTLSIKALNKFLKAEFDEFTELELLEVTGRLLSRSESQMKLIDNFDLYLKEHYKISIFNAKKSGEISEQYGLTTFFDNKVDYSFTEQKVLSAFHQQFGKEKIKDYIKVLEMDNLEFKSDKKTIDELCNFTDKSFLFKAFVEAQYDSLKI